MRQRQFRIFPHVGQYNLKERQWFLGIIPYWADRWSFYSTVESARIVIQQLNGVEI